jgi:TP901 family phage tail tape measure protein
MSTSATSKLDFILRLVDRVSQPLGKVKAGFSDLATKGQNGIKQMGVGMAGMVGAAFTLKTAMAPALGQNAALGEVQSLGVAADALDLLNQKSLEFSIAYGESATAFVSSAYDIQSAIAGLTGTQLATFTGASNLLAKATKADAGTITNYVGTMYGIFQKQADAMGKGAWVEQLTGQTATAVQMFKTTGQGMSNAFTSLGASAASAGIGAAEQMAILGTLQATMSGGEAGTKYRAFLAGAYGAQEKLGLSFTDSQGRLLPMLDILGKLNTRFGELDAAETDLISKAFGGKQAMGLITQLLPKVGDLGNSIDQLGKVKGLEQAEKMASAIADPWERFGSAIMAVRISFGQILLPVLNPLIDRLTVATATFQRWIKLFPNVARWMGYISLGVLGLVAATAGLTVFAGLYGVLSLLFSPLALIVFGIAALVVAIGAAIFWWDELKMKFGQTAWFQALLVMITPVILSLKIMWAVVQVLWRGLEQLVDMGLRFITWLSEVLGVVTGAKSGWEDLLLVFANLSPFALLGNAFKGVITLLNMIPGVEINTSFAELPALQGGTATMNIAEQASAAQRAQQTINAAIPSLSPNRATAVPPGGLLTSIQNNATQNRGTHVEKVEIHTSKPMTTHELEGLMEMAG